MNGKELIAHLRESILDDVALPHLWSDAELLRWLNYAEPQACRRANLIIDSSTANDAGTSGTGGTAGQKPLCQVSITANQAVYSVSPKILQIRRCQLSTMTYPLTGPVTDAELDDLFSGWQGTAGTVGTAGTGGVPTFFRFNGSSIVFILAPSTNDTAYLTVSRLPLQPFGLNTSPEIDEQYHIGLCDWAAHLAYMKPDTETINLNLSKMYEAKFIEQFGTLQDATIQEWRKTLSQKARMRPREFGS